MNVLIVYDSTYGNTENIAGAIAAGFTVPDEVKVVRVTSANPGEIANYQVVIAGSPTMGGRATEPLNKFLSAINTRDLQGTGVAAFDTRFSAKEVGPGIRFLMKVFNFPAPRIAKVLTDKGGKLLGPPEGFFVKGKEGPLLDGELDRATAWAKGLQGK